MGDQETIGQEALDRIVGAVAEIGHRDPAKTGNASVADGLRREASAAIRRAEQVKASAVDGSVQHRVLTGGLRILRLPLTTLETLTGHRESTWGPALGFDIFASAVLQTTGALLGSQGLVDAGRSRRSAAASRLKAAEELARADRLEAEELAEARRRTQQERRSAQDVEDQLSRRRTRGRRSGQSAAKHSQGI